MDNIRESIKGIFTLERAFPSDVTFFSKVKIGDRIERRAVTLPKKYAKPAVAGAIIGRAKRDDSILATIDKEYKGDSFAWFDSKSCPKEIQDAEHVVGSGMQIKGKGFISGVGETQEQAQDMYDGVSAEIKHDEWNEQEPETFDDEDDEGDFVGRT